MSTEKAVGLSGLERPGQRPALLQRRQPAWVGTRERRSWGVPPCPLSQWNPSWRGRGQKAPQGLGVRVSHGQQLQPTFPLGLLRSPPWLPRAEPSRWAVPEPG